MALMLEWEDTREVSFDFSMAFGLGYDFDGWDFAREEAGTPIGRFAIWRDGSRWSYYGGHFGWYGPGFASRDDAQQAVARLVDERSDLHHYAFDPVNQPQAM